MNINTILLIILIVVIVIYIIFDALAYCEIYKDIECLKRGFIWDSERKVWRS